MANIAIHSLFTFSLTKARAAIRKPELTLKSRYDVSAIKKAILPNREQSLVQSPNENVHNNRALLHKHAHICHSRQALQ